MKFATLALLATASAIRIEGAKECVSRKDSDWVFEKIDTNGNGQVDEKELRKAVKDYLEDHKIHVTKEEVRKFGEAAARDAGKDHTLSKGEFHHLANQVAHYVKPKECRA